jgi:hypothetical protein
MEGPPSFKRLMLLEIRLVESLVSYDDWRGQGRRTISNNRQTAACKKSNDSSPARCTSPAIATMRDLQLKMERAIKALTQPNMKG